MKDLWYIQSRANQHETGSIFAVSCADVRALLEERAELLEALKALVNCPDYKGINTHEMTAARAAIAKAEGN